jgi:hypothetical protein
MEIVALPAYVRQVSQWLDDLGQWELDEYLAIFPDAGDLIPGGRGVRKPRWRIPWGGKRGGLRIICYWQVEKMIFLLTAYAKPEKEDLTPSQLKALVRLLEG